MKLGSTVALSALIAAGCSSNGYDPSSLVNSLRVLAVSADKPFAEPGEQVHLELLFADPLRHGRPVQIAWALCINPGSAEIGACVEASGSFQTSSSSYDVTIPSDALDSASADAPIGSVGVLFAACAGTIVAEAGRAAPVRCVDGQGVELGRDGFVWGEKRLVVVRGLRNDNPRLGRVRVDGVTWGVDDEPTLAGCDAARVEDCAAEGQHALQVDVAVASFEEALGHKEDLVGFFFTSQGQLRDDFQRPDVDGTLLTVLALSASDRARPVLLWFVVRDDRGGVTFTSRRARLR